MLEKQLTQMCSILKSKDLKEYAGDCFLNFIKAVLFCDPSSAFDAVKDAASLVIHFPAMIFWDKMKRFLYGTFKDYEEQTKIAQKFNPDNGEYIEYVKNLIYIVDEIDDDRKIDFFAQLTRCLLMTDLEKDLYFKLVNYIKICTPHELIFLKNFAITKSSENTAMISSLYQYGLFVQNDKISATNSRYVLSDFAKALKQDCLNFDDGLNGQDRLSSYDKLGPLNIVEPLRWETI